MLARALGEKLIKHNVAGSIDKKLKPKARRREMRFLSTDEIERIFTAAAGTRFVSLIAIALATGARRGELLGLKWDDVDLARGTVSIRRSIEQTRLGGIREKLPKNGKARLIALMPDAVETLRRLRLADADTYGIGRIGGPRYVIAGDGGAAWAPHQVSAAFANSHARRASCRRSESVFVRRRDRRAGLRPCSRGRRIRRGPPRSRFTRCGIPAPACCSVWASIPRSCKRCSGTVASASDGPLQHAIPSLQFEAAQRLGAVLHLPLAGAASA